MNQPTVLVVENDPGETLLMALSFGEHPLRFRVTYVYDEHEAMDYLKGAWQFSNRELYPFPDCVVIDLQMPRLAGLALLYWIRKQPWLGSLPVILLSTSARSKPVPKANTFVIPANDTQAVFSHLESITFASRGVVQLNSFARYVHN